MILESLGGRGPAVSLWLKPKAAPKNGGTEDWRIKGYYLFSDTPLAEGLANFELQSTVPKENTYLKSENVVPPRLAVPP